MNKKMSKEEILSEIEGLENDLAENAKRREDLKSDASEITKRLDSLRSYVSGMDAIVNMTEGQKHALVEAGIINANVRKTEEG